MLEYIIDVTEELKKVGITPTTAKKTKIFSQSSMSKFKNGDTTITMESLDRLCSVLNMQPGDLIRHKENEKDKVLERKSIDNHEFS